MKHFFNQKLRRRIKRTLKCSAIIIVLMTIVWNILLALFPFPTQKLDRWQSSPAVFDCKGRPLLSIISPDQQWRRSVGLDEMSDWLIKATLAVEDGRFYDHGGIDPLSIMRAVKQNITCFRTISGASTLDMQICRMMEDRPRTYTSKLIEAFYAIRLNDIKSKDDILALYLNNAPYGGNYRGVEMASLVYFDKHARDLSLGEAALIAGLPQSPSRLQPDKNLPAALKRQKTVLQCMLDKQMITAKQMAQAREGIIVKSERLNTMKAFHAGWMALNRQARGGKTTIDLDIQNEMETLAAENLTRLPPGTEQAVVIIDIENSSIVALAGSGDPSDPVDGQVNGALARRSPGSALKPFIYAAAFEAGRLNRHTMVHDIPIQRGGWNPANFNRTFTGKTTVENALVRSLNVPAILVAEGIGLSRCCRMIQQAGIHLPPDAIKKGGLALAVGGIEVSLLELTNAYATLGRQGIRSNVRLYTSEPVKTISAIQPDVCAVINDILSSHNRSLYGTTDSPDSIPWFMYKTGTSSGRRDAWAVGHNGKYAIGIWVGQFRGTGRYEYVGIQAAVPLLTAIFTRTSIRNDHSPPAPPKLIVRNPLPAPKEVAANLKIITPSNGDIFYTINGIAMVNIKANTESHLTWFLNGKVIDTNNKVDAHIKANLTPGIYDLKCIDQKATNASIQFTVRSSRSPISASAKITPTSKVISQR
ncbi:MAG: penicillin-binding protein 1C [Phycisphaerae bacterium]|nr:penicillin-binding protein 1C [Phycisphaerae bacterium]